MDYNTYADRLDYLLEMIEKGDACSPGEIAERFNCCDKTVRNMINRLREKGYHIKFSRTSQKYVLQQ